MNKILIATIIILLLSQQLVEARGFRITQQSLKKSLTYDKVLEKAKVLMGPDNVAKLDAQLTALNGKSQQEIVDYFVQYQYNGDVKNYWYQYYLLAKTLFQSGKAWVRPTMPAVTDPLYKEIVDAEDTYNLTMDTVRNSANSFLSLRSDQSLTLGSSGTLYNLEYNYETLELIQKDPLFQHISKVLPKGIIHHIHWSASTDYIGFHRSIATFFNSQPQDGERVVAVSVQVYLEDVTVGKKITEKFYTKYFLTKQKYIDPSNVQATVDANKAAVDGFIENVTQDGKCLNYIKDSTKYNPSTAETYLKGFLYWKNCKGVVYDETMSQSKTAKSLEDLKKLLKETVACFQTDEQAIKKLPKAYLADNMNETKETKEILGVWFFFEQIFQSFSEFTDHQAIFKQLTSDLFQVLKDQNTQGIEFRNKNDAFQIGSFEENSTKYSIPYSFITPGRKISGTGSKGGSIVSGAKKLLTDATTKLAGIDFFAFEDDPYNGARNFFPSAFTEIQKSETTSYFDQMFDYLEVSKGSMYLHAGETQFFPQGDITDEYMKANYINDNLLHAALLPGIKRVGHGFEANKNNLLLSILNEKKVSFEACPISNQVLNFNEVGTGPFLPLLRSGSNVSISPDDPGLFGYMGVAMDWYYIIMNTDIKASEIYLLLKNSIEYSSIKDVKDNKQKYLQKVKDDLVTFYTNMKNIDYSKIPLAEQQQQIIEQPTFGNTLKFFAAALSILFLLF